MKEKEDRDFMSDLNHQPSYNDDMYRVIRARDIVIVE